MADSASHETSAGDIQLHINTLARITKPSEDWIDADYDRWGATLHLSSNRHKSKEELEAAIANRHQRMSLNTGDNTVRVSEFSTENGFNCEVVATVDGSTIPVQFIAYDANGAFVSGAFVLAGRVSPADSIRPILLNLENEAIAILQSLQSR